MRNSKLGGRCAGSARAARSTRERRLAAIAGEQTDLGNKGEQSEQAASTQANGCTRTRRFDFGHFAACAAGGVTTRCGARDEGGERRADERMGTDRTKHDDGRRRRRRGKKEGHV
jgi:hypothetical protein